MLWVDWFKVTMQGTLAAFWMIAAAVVLFAVR